MGRLGFSCIAFLVGSSLALPVGAQTYRSLETATPYRDVPAGAPVFDFGVTSLGLKAFGSPVNRDLMIGSDQILFPDFLYTERNQKLFTRGVGLGEFDNPANLFLRRADGSAASPRPVGDGELVGIIWAQALGSNGNFHSSTPGSPYYGRTGMIAFSTTEVPTGTGRGGTVSFALTRNGTVVPHDGAWFTNTGRLILAGKDYTLGWRNSLNMRDGPGNLTVLAPDDGTPAIAIRRYSDTAVGFSLVLNPASGALQITRDTAKGSFAAISLDSDRPAIAFKGPARLAAYDVNALPSASQEGEGAEIYIRNGPNGPGVAVSDGARWRYTALGPAL